MIISVGVYILLCMMMSSNGNIFCFTGPLGGESTGHWWIPLTKASDVELWCFLWYAPEQTAEQTIETLVIGDEIMLIMTSLCGEGWFNIKMPSYQYRISHCVDKMILRLSYLHNGIFFTGCMTFLYWIRPWCICQLHTRRHNCQHVLPIHLPILMAFKLTIILCCNPDSKDSRIDINYISIRHKSVRLITNCCQSKGLWNLCLPQRIPYAFFRMTSEWRLWN